MPMFACVRVAVGSLTRRMAVCQTSRSGRGPDTHFRIPQGVELGYGESVGGFRFALPALRLGSAATTKRGPPKPEMGSRFRGNDMAKAALPLQGTRDSSLPGPGVSWAHAMRPPRVCAITVQQNAGGVRGVCNMGLMNQAPTRLRFVRAPHWGVQRGEAPLLRVWGCPPNSLFYPPRVGVRGLNCRFIKGTVSRQVL
jgi:hypothetical protein